MISRRLRLVGVSLLAAATLAGCGSQGASVPAPTATPSPAAIVTPAGARVGLVDLEAVVRAHRRWPELDALLKKTAALQLRLSSPPSPPDAPPVTVINLQAEADRLQASLRAELDALHAQANRRLEALANDLRAEQEGKLADRQRELNAELQRVIDAKRNEFQQELDKFELATMTEYRIPLANLRIKGDVVGITNEEEAKRLGAEADRIAKERDGKIRAKSEALAKALEEFQKARQAEAEAQFNTLVRSLEDDAKTRYAAKEAEANAEMQQAIRSREDTLRTAMEARKKMLEGGVQEQYRAAQERYVKQTQAEEARLRTELQALLEQRARLEDAVLAEIKIEVAAMAQAQKVDVVLTRVIARVDAIDLTPAVIAKIKGK